MRAPSHILVALALAVGILGLAPLASLAATGVETIPPPPRAKPAVPSDLVGLTRGLSPAERRAKTAIGQANLRAFSRARGLIEAGDDPIIHNLIDWIAFTDPRSEPRFEAIAAFVTGHPRWPLQGRMLKKAEEALVRGEDAGLPDAALLSWFQSQPPVTADGAALFSGVLLRAGKKDQAIATVRKAWVERDFTAKQEKSFRKRFGRFLTADDEWHRLDRLLLDRKVNSAKRQARRLGKGYEKLAHARLALALRRPGVDWAIRQVPAELAKDPGLLYERGRWRWKRRLFEGVQDILPQLPREPKWLERSWRMRLWAARKASNRGQFATAYRLASEHGLESGVGFAEGEWLAGWLALKEMNNPEQAYQHFVRLYEGVSSTISRGRGAYWAGEAAQAMGNSDWANRWYEVGAGYGSAFYGQLAAQRLGRPLDLGDSVTSPIAPERRRQFFASEDASVVRLLARIGERKLQKRFLHALRRTAEGLEDYRLVAELAANTGQLDMAHWVAKDARRQGIVMGPTLFPEVPLPASARDHQIEQALVLGVIRQESAFNSLAVSPAGARGLMQLMPATARAVARSARLPYSRSLLTEDPTYNVTLGQRYLGRLVRRFDGSYILALAGYNAGPSRALQWIKENGDPRLPEVDPIEWIERIPIEETRNYVQRVLEGLAVYRERRPESQASWRLRPSEPAS